MAPAKQATQGGARKGAGRKSNASKGLDTRTEVFGFRVSPAELEALQALAGDEDPSEWARGVLFSVRSK